MILLLLLLFFLKKTFYMLLFLDRFRIIINSIAFVHFQMKMIILSFIIMMLAMNRSMTRGLDREKRFECQTNLTMIIIQELLATYPCVSLELAHRQQRTKRSQEIKGISIGDKNTNIEEKQTITYIINNSSDVSQRTNSVHENSTILTNFGGWRDLLLILCIVLHFVWIFCFMCHWKFDSIIYYLMDCCCSTASIERIQQMKQEKKLSKSQVYPNPVTGSRTTSTVRPAMKRSPTVATIQHDNDGFLDF